MNKTKDIWGAALTASRGLQALDAEAKAAREASRETAGAWPLDGIKERPKGDTRPINEEHAARLAESLDALGLLEPLVIDRVGHLLAGGHRLAALRMLRERGQWPHPVPVRIMDFDAVAEPGRALAVEIAENEQRRDYSAGEVRTLADRLEAAGYKTTRGKPKAGERALLPALETIVGKSQRQILRYLAPEAPKEEAEPDKLETAGGRLAMAAKAYRKAAEGRRGKKVAEVLAALELLEDALDVGKE